MSPVDNLDIFPLEANPLSWTRHAPSKVSAQLTLVKLQLQIVLTLHGK